MLALESELGDGFVGQRLGGNDHVGRALNREMAQAQVDTTTAQSLAQASKPSEFVDGHDHWAWAVQHRSLHPRRVEHVGLAGAMRLDDLSAGLARVAQSTQQAARIPSDAARVAARAAVERDPHAGLSAFQNLDADSLCAVASSPGSTPRKIDTRREIVQR